MTDIFVNIMTTAASGCIVALFANWLRKRNDKQATSHTKNPLTTGIVRGFGAYMHDIFVNCIITPQWVGMQNKKRFLKAETINM